MVRVPFPEPQATSATRVPVSASPPSLGRGADLLDKDVAVHRLPQGVHNVMHLRQVGIHGTPPPSVKHLATATSPLRVITETKNATGARLSYVSPVSTAACSTGSQKRRFSASYSKMPAVAIAASHSRTYRSWRPPRSASSADVAGPAVASSNSRVRQPISMRLVSRPPVMISTSLAANSSTRCHVCLC